MPGQKIKNFDELATSDMRRAALLVAEEGLQAIDTGNAVKKLVRLQGEALEIGNERLNRKDIGKIIVAGIGKCAGEAGKALEDILGDNIARGIVLDIRPVALKKIKAFQGTHPLPSTANIEAAAAMVEMLKGLDENDLVIFVISGGGSTLLCLPDDMGCEEEAKILNSLTQVGATIQEINAVRKHLSLARGGYLAKYAYPARAISLIFSDVPGNDIQFVASGPTVKDKTTVSDAEAILAKYDILRVCNLDRCGLVETPKDSRYFNKVKNILATSNVAALMAMQKKAKELVFDAKVCDDRVAGEARNVGVEIANQIDKALPHSVLLYGGETTVTVRGRGSGGRNLELALAATCEVREGQLIMTIASDGRDNGEYAGAIADVATRKKAEELKMDMRAYLDENNEYPFYERVGNYLMTGDTGSNVSDLVIALKN